MCIRDSIGGPYLAGIADKLKQTDGAGAVLVQPEERPHEVDVYKRQSAHSSGIRGGPRRSRTAYCTCTSLQTRGGLMLAPVFHLSFSPVIFQLYFNIILTFVVYTQGQEVVPCITEN